ncbi:MAG: Abi family protein [Prevotella sp.]|jgi:abortive infection bacteriophage resistance protein|nr:Abi family protein [Prevotella sp.]
MKESTTIEEQLRVLTNRGMTLDIGDDKAKEILGDIGYFRLGFYCFPFEKSYPQKQKRSHLYRKGAKISDVVNLYYFDMDLRNILVKYINRIEVNFRTKVVYEVSNKYNNSSTWFVDPSIMTRKYIDEFDDKVYTTTFKRYRIIKLHHDKYINDKYAPAWKTLEFLTFGGVLTIFKNLKDLQVRECIAKKYGVRNVEIFEGYMNSIVEIRNTCAHGRVLFDFTLAKSLRNGPALSINNSNKNILNSVIEVIIFILKGISENRAIEMRTEINNLFNKHKSNSEIKCIIENCTGYKYS